MNTIEVGLEKTALDMGIPLPIFWDYGKAPHMALFGRTGEGKTYLLKLILGRIALHVPDSGLTICDYKGDDDFSFLNGCDSFYRYSQCEDGLNSFAELLSARQAGADKKRHCFLVIDEFAALVSSCEKKKAESLKLTLAKILMLGRSFHLHVILSQQSLHAEYFQNARLNISAVIGLGYLSKEISEMMFSDFKEILDRNKSRGTGSCLIGGSFNEIIVPQIRSMEKLEMVIRSVMPTADGGA